MARKKLTAEQLKERHRKAYDRRIQSAFKNAGFEYLATEHKQKKFGTQTGDIDAVFLFENILLVCETTTATKNITSHIKDKKIYFDEVKKHESDLIAWLKELHPDKFAAFDGYSNERYFIFYLYFTETKLNLPEEDANRFTPIKIVEDSSLSYFHDLSKNIKFSARTEIYRFLGLKSGDIGQLSDAAEETKRIRTTIIYPKDQVGQTDEVRLVSFMMSAETLMRNSYVLRKDNWERTTSLYQRLINKTRIQSVRKYLASKERTFFNNVIVSLPDGIRFTDTDGDQVKLEDIKDYKKKYTLELPNEFNSICIIDGQHRIFAHYEGVDELEKKIKPLREKFHLLVTGLIFPKDMKDHERRKYESEIFLDINSNARPVPADVLLFIETLKNPFSDIGIARVVLEKLNQREPFHNLLEMSLMEKSRIKIASIIKYALRGFVEIDDSRTDTLYYHWSKSTGKKIVENDTDNLDEYIDYVVSTLSIYFSTLKSVYKDQWDNTDSKILSTTSINGFIIALRRVVKTDGVKDYAYYETAFKKHRIDFVTSFPYASSQYKRFAREVILKEFFDIDEPE